MSNLAHLLPRRIHAAATALANARFGRHGDPAVEDILDHLPAEVFKALVEDATLVLDAAHAVAPDPDAKPADPQARRINLAASVGLDLDAQATVLIDVARDGTVRSSSWAGAGGGTRSLAIGDWANGLLRTHLTAVPFQTAFGMGFDGRPTPLTHQQRETLSAQGQAYADRYTIGPGSPEATARPLDAGDAEALGRALGAGSLLILARDRNGAARGVLWAVSAEAREMEPGTAQALWTATAGVLGIIPLADSAIQLKEPRP